LTLHRKAIASFRRRARGLRRRIVTRLEARGTYPTWVLVAALTGVFAASFPITILTISLTAIAAEFGARETTIAWVISGPVLLSAVALPLLGKLGDLRGHRRVFLRGFAAASVAAALTACAWDAPSLIGLRTLAAVVGAATQPTSMALILSVYPPQRRARAMAWWAMMGGAAPAAGLIAGGPLVDLFGWRIVFVLQSLFSFVALTLASLVLRETPRQRVRFDVAGALTLAVGVAALMFALGRSRDAGPASATIWGSMIIGVVGLVAFAQLERRVTVPLLPLEYFRQRNFSASLLGGTFMGAAYMGAFVITPIVLLQIFHYSVTTTAGIMLLRTTTLTISSPLGGHLGTRIGERTAATLGSALVGVSLLVVAYGTVHVSLLVLCVGLVLQGLGNGIGVPPMTSAIATAVPDKDLGLAAAASRLTSQVGVAFGITTLTMVYGGVNTGEALAHAFIVGAVLAACALTSSLFMAPNRHSPSPGNEFPGSVVRKSAEADSSERL
jgi:EmrB/QacA subfamily drug resistance transporter